jgi:ribosome-binding factor A
MGQRVVRVNELLKREISHVLHTRFQSESVAITITDVEVTPNLRKATVYYSVVLDNPLERENIHRFLRRNSNLIRHQVGQVIVLKYLPHLEFLQDCSSERGMQINKLIDELGLEGEAVPEKDSGPEQEESRDV